MRGSVRSRTTKNLRRQIERIVDARTSDIGLVQTDRVTSSNFAFGASFGLGTGNITGIYETLAFLQNEMRRSIPNWIKGFGGDIIPDPDNPKGIVVKKFDSSGGAVGGGQIYTLEEDVKIDFYDHLASPLEAGRKTAHAGSFFICLDDGGIFLTTSLRSVKAGILGKVVIPTPKTEYIQADNPEWDNWKAYYSQNENSLPIEYNYNAYIVSARDPFFAADYSYEADDAFDRKVWTSLQKLPISMILGESIVIGDNITLSNEFGNVSLSPTGLYFYGVEKDENGNTVNTDEVIAQFTPDKAFIGDIELNKTDIRSKNYTPGITGDGFYISAAGNAVFSNVIVKGTIYAMEGRIGMTSPGTDGWVINSGKISAYDGITEKMSLSSDNLSLWINDSTWQNEGIQIEYNGGTPRIYAGDGANNYFQFTGSSVSVSGVIYASSGWFGGANGWWVGDGAILSASASNFSIGLVTEAFAGFSDRMIFVRGSSGSGLPSYGDAGIQLYHDVAGGLSKFYCGDGSNAYFEFNGSGVSYRGTIYGESGWFGGSGGWAIGDGAILSASASNFSIGLITEAFAGFSDRMIFIRGSSGSGLPSFGDAGIQLYHDVAGGEAKFHLGEAYGGGTNYLHYTSGGGLEIAGSVTVSEVGKWIINGDALEAQDSIGTPLIALVSDGNDPTPDPHIWVMGSTFGNQGIQIQYNSGTPRIYIGDGSNQYFKFDGTNIAWKGTNSELTAAGAFSASNATITGVITANTGYIGGSGAGWIISSGKITSDGGSLVLDSDNDRIDIGSPTVSDGVRIGSSGIQMYDGGTLKGQWDIDTTFWIGPSSTNKKVSWNPDTDTFSVRGNAAFDTLVWQEVLTTKGYLIVAKSGGELYEDMTATATTFTVKVKEPLSGGAPFQSGDRLKIDNGINSTWFTVGSGSDQGAYYQYTGTYQSGSNSATYREGTGIVDFGASGDCYLEMVADPSGGGDVYYSVKTHAGSPWSATTEHLRTGNLNGYLGIASDEFGFAAGSNSGSNPNLIISPTYGFKLRRGSTTSMHFDTDGTFEITGDASNSISWDGATMTIRGALVADDITSGIMTAIRIRTASSGSRVELGYSNWAFIYYDASNNPRFQIFDGGTYVDDVVIGNPSDGNEGYVWWDSSESRLTVRGALNASDIIAGTVSGDYISGGTIEGTTIQTAASNQRVVIDGSANTLSFYDSDNTLALELDSDSTIIPGLTTALLNAPANLIIKIEQDTGIYNAPGLVVNRGDDQAAVYGDKIFIRDTSSTWDRVEMTFDAIYFYQGSSTPYIKLNAESSLGGSATYTLPDLQDDGFIPISIDDTDREVCKNLDTQAARSKLVKFTYTSNYTAIHEVLDIPADSMITNMRLTVTTAWNCISCTVDIGYDLVTGTDDLDYFANNVDVTSIGEKSLSNYRWVVPASSAATIELTFSRSGTPTAGEFILWIEYTSLTETFN